MLHCAIVILIIRLVQCMAPYAISEGSFGTPRVWNAFESSYFVVVDLRDELISAASSGNARAVKKILRESIMDPSFDENIVFRTACGHGHSEVVKLLLKDKRVDPTDAGNDALVRAIKNGHHLVTILLLFNNRVHRSYDRKEALLNAIYHGHKLIVQLLLTDWRLDPSFDGALPLVIACYYGHDGIARMLMGDERVRQAAAENKKLDLGGLGHPSVDLTADDLFLMVVKGGHAGLVGLFLESPDLAEASSDENRAMILACRSGHPEVVKLLLAFGRFDPTANENKAIQVAARHGHAAVLALLLQHPKVDPSARRNRAIRKSSKYGHAECVRILLADKRVDPSASNNAAIRSASERGHAQVAELLLTDKRVDPKAANFVSTRRHKAKAILKLIATVQKFDSREAVKLKKLNGLSRRELKVLARRFADDKEIVGMLAAQSKRPIDIHL